MAHPCGSPSYLLLQGTDRLQDSDSRGWGGQELAKGLLEEEQGRLSMS